MASEWQELTKLTGGREMVIRRVGLIDCEIAIEGEFELPPLARLTAEDQVFIAAFVRCHGSIKRMEQLFGISYPTVKNRLNRLSDQLDFVNIEASEVSSAGHDVLGDLETGSITASEAIRKLSE